MLDLLVWASWFIFGAYSFWFFSQAKTYQPLTLDDLALTWKLHKQQTGCKASRLHSLLTKNNNVIGFKCECSKDYLQKRLITQKAHTYIKTSIPSPLSPKITNLLETKSSLENLGLQYSHIKQI